MGIAMVLFLAPAYAKDVPPRDAEELHQTLRVLEERIRRLEADQSSQNVQQEHEELRPRFGLNLGLYGDVSFSSTPRGQERPTFGLGDAGLYSTARSGDRLTFLFEAELEIEGAGEAAEMAVERYWVGYAFSDRLVVRAGRVHTALGYWNRVYHHARYFYSTVDRPFVLAFHGILPVHIVGVEATGTLWPGATSLQYELEVGNGPQFDPPHQGLVVSNAIDDPERSKQVALRLIGRRASLPGSTLGISATTFAFDVPSLREYIFGIDIAHSDARLEWIAEGWRLLNRTAGGWAGYLQTTWKAHEVIRPFARIERLVVDETDPYLVAMNAAVDRHEVIAGIRVEIETLHSALKAQYRRDARADDRLRHFAEVQWAFGF
jgi:hypothetical protein